MGGRRGKGVSASFFEPAAQAVVDLVDGDPQTGFDGGHGGQAVGGVIFGLGAYLAAWRLCAAGLSPGPASARTQMFRVPLSALTVYRGWTGLFGSDRRGD